MTIQFLKAFNGDSIWISYYQEEIPRNILIDGGIGDTYRNILNQAGDLCNTINTIRGFGQRVDLLVLTHFDDDHIGGILRWLNKDKAAADFIDVVWFNSGKSIAEFLNLQENEELSIEIKEDSTDFHTSVKQGIKFENYLKAKNLWDGALIKQGDCIDYNGIRFKILSPNVQKLRDLVELYKEEEDYFTKGGEYDFDTSLQAFIDEESGKKFRFKEDSSVANGSSIAFLMEIGTRQFLFLGDAHPSVVIEGLKHFGFDNEHPLKVDLFKVSHHGSKHNTSKALLEVVNSDHFVISSNGMKHGLPNKRTMARIISSNPQATIHFNYTELKPFVFQKSDFEDYKSFAISSIHRFDY